MKTIEIFSAKLAKLPKLPQPLKKFLLELVVVFLICPGRYNFMNLSRWSSYNERSFRRNYDKDFAFVELNKLLIDAHFGKDESILAIDASYVRKSGKHSFGVDRFWSGVAQQVVWGQEVSVVSLISVPKREALSLSIEQTPVGQDENRLDVYLAQVGSVAAYAQNKSKYLVADGYYAKDKVWQKMDELGLFLITKLRNDADMHFVYQGEQKGRGRPRIKGDKVYWKQRETLEQFDKEAPTPEGWQVYSKKLYSVKWKRILKVVWVHKPYKDTTATAVFACSDIDIPAHKLIEYYRLRFQIEFLFRDAKQHLGLEHCQSRQQKRLDFHFNAVMMTLNLAIMESSLQGKEQFSMQDLKTEYFNRQWLDMIITNLDLDADKIKNHPNFPKLLQLGKLAA